MQEKTNATINSIKFPEYKEANAAGLDNLNKYGVINIIDSLAGGDITKWDKVSDLNLSYILLKYNLECDKAHNDHKLHLYNSRQK